MDPNTKYNVPALARAHEIIRIVAENPSQYKLIDLSRELGIHKSSMFSLLQTMERLGWLHKDPGDRYQLGAFFGRTGSLYFRQWDLVSDFHREAADVKTRLEETLQLGRLEGRDVFYLAKEEAPSPVRLMSEPGMTWAAYATGLGKAMLAYKSDDEVRALFPEEKLHAFTPNTVSTTGELLRELADVRKIGVATDKEEAVIGFSCAAAPVRGPDGRVIAAVSCSIPQYRWAEKRELAVREIVHLARTLSYDANISLEGR